MRAAPRRPGKKPDLVAEPAAGGVDEVEDRQQVAVGPLEDADLLLAPSARPTTPPSPWGRGR